MGRIKDHFPLTSCLLLSVQAGLLASRSQTPSNHTSPPNHLAPLAPNSSPATTQTCTLSLLMPLSTTIHTCTLLAYSFHTAQPYDNICTANPHTVLTPTQLPLTQTSNNPPPLHPNKNPTLLRTDVGCHKKFRKINESSPLRYTLSSSSRV